VPRSLVSDPAFGWQDGQRPWHRYADTVLYEIHVKGFTMRHPDIPPELRGTYAGLGHEAAIAHLTGLGVTTVELLPVHQNVPESFLIQRGLTNYWGYNTIGFFAPHNGYSAAVRAGRPGGQVNGFDLAPTLARQEGGYSKVSVFLDMAAQDPVVSRAKLVAEPWDVGQMDSYDLGRFPALWREWNGT
jgi:pullulanase/glycogen debranching enzyme